MDGTDNMKNQIEDISHDCGTPQGDGCQVCADQFNQIMNGPKVVYKESSSTTDQIKLDISTLALKMADEEVRYSRLIIAKVILELIDQL